MEGFFALLLSNIIHVILQSILQTAVFFVSHKTHGRNDLRFLLNILDILIFDALICMHTHTHESSTHTDTLRHTKTPTGINNNPYSQASKNREHTPPISIFKSFFVIYLPDSFLPSRVRVYTFVCPHSSRILLFLQRN